MNEYKVRYILDTDTEIHYKSFCTDANSKLKKRPVIFGFVFETAETDLQAKLFGHFTFELHKLLTLFIHIFLLIQAFSNPSPLQTSVVLINSICC